MWIEKGTQGLALLLTGCLLGFATPLLTGAEPGTHTELLLRKEDPYMYGACGWCTDLLTLDENENLKNMTDYNRNFQTGYFLIDLLGPAGTTVTLFGAQNYTRDQGYLILVKKDDHPIEVGDLAHLPPNQWVVVDDAETGPGVYSLWYHPAGHFKERIASVRWGRWWTELPPANEKE